MASTTTDHERDRERDSNSFHEGFSPKPLGVKTIFDADDDVVVVGSSSERSRHWEPEKERYAERGNDRYNEYTRDRDRDRDRDRSHQRTYGGRQRSHHKRERSQERRRHRSEERDYNEPRSKNYQEANAKRRRVDEEADEINFLPKRERSPAPRPNLKRKSPSPELGDVPPRTQVPERRQSGLFDFTKRVLKTIVGSPTSIPTPAQTPSNTSQDILEKLCHTEVELKFTLDLLDESTQKCKEQEGEINHIEADRKSLQREVDSLQERVIALSEENERLKKENSEFQLGLQKSRSRAAEFEESLEEHERLLDQARQHIADQHQQFTHQSSNYERRVNELISEKGTLRAQLKQQARVPPAEKTMDIFDNTADQVSEASIRGAVESLNDSIDNLILGLFEVAEQLVKERDPAYGVPATKQDVELLAALARYCENEDKRGFILEALCHDYIVQHMQAALFDGDPVPRMTGRENMERILVQVTRSVPWSVAQRWRAITAESFFKAFNAKQQHQSVSKIKDSMIEVFSWAYQQPPETFRCDAFTAPLAALDKLFQEAEKLALSIRTDVLSVRMSVFLPRLNSKEEYGPYNPGAMEAVWSDMGSVEGDKVLTVYHLGLRKQTQSDQGGAFTTMIRPQVATMALLREMEKDT
ncbi:hypothetical protein MIND_01299500 [Mycena indigotica]|uniref:Uncharacterized protein n=1 Tax=Mycena indigotica TaxID=2126181 RepID=A0A8H6VR25_9AGAR|nr:uncharacterized protein MIND_01299500 [Mycena indigotica]KAF7290594.1 hypothetical protein MIND_01299500 [Mycena indigotica]